MRDLPASNAEQGLVLQSVLESKRLDGRGIYDYRKTKFTFGPAYGQVEVQLGQTRVLCQVSCEVVAPSPDQPAEGFVNYNTELSQMASPAFEPGRPSELAIEIGRIIERGFRDSRAVETEGLCIVAGKKVWSVRVDTVVLDYCGNAVDAVAMAAAAALRHFRRPDVTVSGEEATIHDIEEREPVPLAIHHNPMTVSFAFFTGGDYLVVDPSLAEERVAEGSMTITMNVHKEICAIHKTGCVALSTEQMIRCVKVAQVKVMEVADVISTHLEEYFGPNKRGTLPTRAGAK
eukprot:Ihof_evm1s41 gene=Ihof_evmTU1s41